VAPEPGTRTEHMRQDRRGHGDDRCQEKSRRVTRLRISAWRGLVAAVMAALGAAALRPELLLADGGILVGTAAQGPVMVGVPPRGASAYRVVANATGSSRQLWLLVEDVATSVEAGVYDDTGARLLGSCTITRPASLPSWAGCSLPRAVQTSAGHAYWLAIGHASGSAIWWATEGKLCDARSVFWRSAGLPDPFPLRESTCGSGGTNVAMYLGDASPPLTAPERSRVEATAVPTAVPTAASETRLTTSGSCYQVTVSGNPGATVSVQPTDTCPGDGQAGTANDGGAPQAGDGTTVPTGPEGDPGAQDGDGAP